MNRQLRVIGGVAHGKHLAGEGKYLRVPVPPGRAEFHAKNADMWLNPFRFDEYVRQRIPLGPIVTVEVWALGSLSEQQLMRRVADIIDSESVI